MSKKVLPFVLPIVKPNVEAVGDALEDVVLEFSVWVIYQLIDRFLCHQRECHSLEPVMNHCSADPLIKLTEVRHACHLLHSR